jgi:hypothetical protein
MTLLTYMYQYKNYMCKYKKMPILEWHIKYWQSFLYKEEGEWELRQTSLYCAGLYLNFQTNKNLIYNYVLYDG